MELRRVKDGSVTSTPGFAASAVACGIKPDAQLDLALVVSSVPCVASAVFTRNRFRAAPVIYDQAVLAENPAGVRAVLINSGCANACTGQPGLDDARREARVAAEACTQDGAPVSTGDVMVMSTGVIGVRLPMEKLLGGIADAASSLAPDTEAGHRAARAIMTTDTRPKEASVTVEDQGVSYTISGMCKGSGMIHPDMATMLAMVTTDARLSPAAAQAALLEAVEQSFNMVTVDGDTSTNDTLLLLANGLSDMETIAVQESTSFKIFVSGLCEVCVALAKEIARDGEGATRFIEIAVNGASSRADAKQVAMAIAHSPLVKTAVYGQDANWGRIVCAVGYSGVDIQPELVSVWLGDLELVRNGEPYHVDEERAADLLAESDIAIRVDLGSGPHEATVWTCDLSHAYVDINAHYRT